MPARFRFALALLAGAAATHPHTAPAQQRCFLGLEGRLPAPDSLAVTASPASCGVLRLVLTGRPQRVAASRLATRPGEVEWAIPVALVNAGTRPVYPPMYLARHSLVALQRGRPLTVPGSRNLVGAHPNPEEPYWVFEPPPGSATLGPGQRSARTVRVVTHALTQGYHLLLSPGGGALQNWGAESDAPPPARTPPGTTALPPEAARFVDGAGLGAGIHSAALVHDAARGITVFTVLIPEPACMRACGELMAIGVRHGTRVGWLWHNLKYGIPSLAPRLDAAPFTLSARDDAELLTTAFVARLREGTRRWPFLRAKGADWMVLEKLLTTPGVPRDLLLGMIRELYAEGNEDLARQMLEVRGASDPVVLAQLAVIPGGGDYFPRFRGSARYQLRERARDLAGDPSLSAATLFAVATSLEGPASPDLARKLAEHPAARANPAILAVLHGHAGDLAPRLLESVRAPAAQKARLATVLAAGSAAPDARRRAAEALAADPAAAEDVLVVLANLAEAPLLDAAWRASRRLPERTLRRWESPVAPLP